MQNPEDGAALAALGIEPARIALIRGSGVDIRHFTPLPMPGGDTVTVALVSRMLRDKGVLDAVAAIRSLRAAGPAGRAGAGRPDRPRQSPARSRKRHCRRSPPSRGSPGSGAVEDVREVWRRAAIAVLPSTYGEGVPKALLEAAACARPIVASDMPGCREAVPHRKARAASWCRRTISARLPTRSRRSPATRRGVRRWAGKAGRWSSRVRRGDRRARDPGALPRCACAKEQRRHDPRLARHRRGSAGFCRWRPARSRRISPAANRTRPNCCVPARSTAWFTRPSRRGRGARRRAATAPLLGDRRMELCRRDLSVQLQPVRAGGDAVAWLALVTPFGGYGAVDRLGSARALRVSPALMPTLISGMRRCSRD